MDEEAWLKAIKCTKEELIEWLNEMYKDEKINRDIILKYEKLVNVRTSSKGDNTTIIEAPGFSYCRKGW